jgi:CubicO group peptidase (beta-lactamase class C family)
VGRASLPLVAAIALLAASVFACPRPASSQERPKAPAPRKPQAAQRPVERIDGVLEPIRKRHDLPALGGAVVIRDRMTAVGATGVRKYGSEAKVTIDDRWHLGSCTKAMTATLVARLVERGRLRWETTLGESFPKLRDRMDPAYRDVTLELLLGNRGGAPHELSAGGLWGRLRKRRGTPEQQRRQLLHGVVTRPPQEEPGTKFVYSNAGFAIAGHVAETREGKAWEDLMRAEVFGPLGMQSAGFGAPGDAERPDQPWGHRAAKGTSISVPPAPTADNPPAIGPAGTVHATLGDWAKFVAAHLEGEPGRSRLLPAKTFRKLHTPLEGQEYALGWTVTERKWARGRTLTHAGSNTVWYCVVWMAPDRGFAVLVTCNQGGDAARKACDEAAWALIQRTVANLR